MLTSFQKTYENLNCGGYFLLRILRLLDGVRATHSGNSSVLIGEYDLYSDVFALAVSPQVFDLIFISKRHSSSV